MNRREFLKSTGKLFLAATAANTFLTDSNIFAAESQPLRDLKEYDFLFTRVRFNCDKQAGATWNTYPGSERNLLERFSRVVRCKVKLPPNCNNDGPAVGRIDQFNAVVDLTDLEILRLYPFLFMTAEAPYHLNEKQKDNLRQYINNGGFLLMDDCVFADGYGGGDFFYKSSYALLEEIFGEGAVRTIEKDHEVFHNVYDLGNIGLPYMQGVNHGARGVIVEDRLAVFLSSTDLHCGWVDRRGAWFRPNRSRGIHGYEQAIQMGINIIMYAISH